MNIVPLIKRMIPSRTKKSLKDILGFTALQDRINQLEAWNTRLERDIADLRALNEVHRATNHLLSERNLEFGKELASLQKQIDLLTALLDEPSANVEQNIAYVNKLKDDHNFFVREVSYHTERVINHYYKYYQIVPKDYVAQYVDHIKNAHLTNLKAPQFIDHALGLPSRMRRMVEKLEKSGLSPSNKDILDIGCGTGALLLACRDRGAKTAVGVDIRKENLEGARLLLYGKDVQLIELDILSADLPSSYALFDIIFCTELLEHLKDPQLLFSKIKKYLSQDTYSFAYVTVSNRNNLTNIKSEPHYNIPGMILLEHTEAKDLWYRIRRKLNSNQEYEVHNWYSFSDYQAMANSAGLSVSPLYSDNVQIPIHDYEKAAMHFKKELEDMISKLAFDEPLKEPLYRAVEEYCKEYKEDHQLFMIDKCKESDLYYKYYEDKLVMLLKHA